MVAFFYIPIYCACIVKIGHYKEFTTICSRIRAKFYSICLYLFTYVII